MSSIAPDVNPSVVELKQKGFRLFYLSEDTWSASVWLLVGCSFEDYLKWSKAKFNIKDDGEQKPHYAFTSQVKYGPATHDIICLTDKWEWSRMHFVDLIHECHHATTNILRRKGIHHCDETEECWAYLQDSLFARFFWALRESDKKREKRAKAKKVKKKRPLAKKRAST